MTQKVVQVTLGFSLFRHIFYNSYGVYLSGKKKVGDLVFSTDSFSPVQPKQKLHTILWSEHDPILENFCTNPEVKVKVT